MGHAGARFPIDDCRDIGLSDARGRGSRCGLEGGSGELLVVGMAARASGIGSDVQRPLATVVVGGLLSTLLLTLLALPSMYALTVRKQLKAEMTHE